MARNKQSQARRADRHALYERAVQCPEAEIDFVDATFRDLRGRRAHLLREDFCGTAAVCCEWVRRRKDNEAIGVDLDAEVLAWGEKHNLARLRPAARERVRLLKANVRQVHTPPADVVLAMNFSYYIFKERAALRGYFRRVRKALVDDGVFFLDAFGGYDAFRVLRERTRCDGFTYIWHQADYNPVTGEYLCHIDFKFADGSRLRRAFSYDWRLWTLPEIRELLAEAGFARTIVYWQSWDEDNDEPGAEFYPTERGEADAGWICYLAALP